MIKNIACIDFVTFKNEVVMVNTTPHPVTIQDVDGEIVSVPSSCLINAKPIEERVDYLHVRTKFVGDDVGKQTIKDIKETFIASKLHGTLIIVGSIIAAQAYPGEISALCPVPGYERVAPSEKRMRCDKFTTFAT